MEDQVFYQCLIYGDELAAACYEDGYEETIIDYSNLYTTVDGAREYFENFVNDKVEEVADEYGIDLSTNSCDDIRDEIEESYSYEIKELRVIK